MDYKPDDIEELLQFFSKNTYKATESRHPHLQNVMQRCLDLFALDYTYSVIPNNNGELSTSYPSSLIILERDKNEEDDSEISIPTNGNLHSSSFIHPEDTNGFNNVEDLTKIKDLINFARYARCRARFPIPVILFNKKHICRSATLSGGPEIYGRSSLDYLFSGGSDYSKLPDPGLEDDLMATESQSDWQLFDRVRHQDIRLLKSFQVQTIVDLMVEKKKVKFGMNVTSSEKVDRQNRYADFRLISLPYPGCEFFKQYRDNDYNGETLVFEWNQVHVDANIYVPSDVTANSLNLEWSQYRNWDLVHLTQNYLKLLLAYLKDDNSGMSKQNNDNYGMLIHCISGWDRTPLFVSLLRLSLWADGAIHKSLSPEQILYLTLAYDWLLFGHNLEDRLSKGEEILFFCFCFLKHMVGDEFSVEKPEETAQPVVLSSVWNDSDIHLDGVLLDGDTSQTSPEGSNWSLNSCSSQSSNPPTYFQVHDSWEVCNDSISMCQPTKQASSQVSTHGGQNNSSTASLHSQQQPHSNSNGSITNGQPHSPSTKHLQPNNLSSNQKSSSSPHGSSGSSSCSSNSALSKGAIPIIGSRIHGRTSPVAVPVPNRNFFHQHQHQNNNRTESNSSASIGSWQLVTGSLRDAISSSDPGSTYSHVSRTSANDGLDCIEASESSCTLVEEFTPISSIGGVIGLSSKPNSSSTLNGGGGSRRDSKNLVDDGEVVYRDDNVFLLSRQPIMTDPLSIPLCSTSILNEDEVPKVASNTNRDSTWGTQQKMLMSRRHRRLEAVRTHFHDLYTKTIQPPRGGGLNDNSSNSSLSVLIGSIATKVGIRTATSVQRNPS